MAANIIKLKKNNTPGAVPQVSDLYYGELALNTADGILYFKCSSINGDYIESVKGDKYAPYTWNESISGITTSYGLNNILQPFSTILGGYRNTNDGPGSTILNGQFNNVVGEYALIGGGSNNYIGINGDNSAILGGEKNRIDHKNVFTLGSGLTSHASNFTYTNNISSNGIIYANKGNSNQWIDVFTTVNELSSVWNNLGNLGTIVANGSASWNSVVSTVYANSGNWNSVFTNVNTNSATYATYAYVDSNFLNLTGGIIDGTLSVLSSFEVGFGSTILFVSGGKVGINTELPTVELTVNGSISASNKIYGTIIDWMTLTRGFKIEPTFNSTIAGGDVYDYVYSSTPTDKTYYRYIATDGSEDAYYGTFSGGILSNIIAKKEIII